MPSLRAKLLSACAFVAPVLAAVLPSTSTTSSNTLPRPALTQQDNQLLELDLHHSYAQATFTVPCSGCLGSDHTGHDDESLLLSVATHAQDDPCGSSNITLNGVHLPQEYTGDFGFGQGSYGGVVDLKQNAWYARRTLDLEWNSSCLHGHEETAEPAQVLTVNIKAIDGKPIVNAAGFTVSFKQHTSPPSLLRLEPVPNPTVSDKDTAESWREPPQYLRLIFRNETGSAEDSDEPQTLEDSIRELEVLQIELQELQRAIAEKKKHIHSQIKQVAHTFAEKLNECDSITCIFKTIGHSAHGTWTFVYSHFQRFHHQHTGEMGRPEEVFAQTHGHTTQVSGGDIKADLKADTTSEYSRPLPSRAATLVPSPEFELPPRPEKPNPYILALEITLGILCCGCIAIAIRQRCCSPQRRAERAARREERLKARAYRRAARRHAWKNWWRGNWARRVDQERIEDYEEKRALIKEQEGVLENAMQEEIRQLRAAHDVVNDLVRDAEEGRVASHSHCTCYHNRQHTPESYSPLSTASTYPPTSLPDIPSRPLSRTDSLPSYRSDCPTEPPNYDSDMDMSGTVADGLRQYSSSNASDMDERWTPDSSVIDVSPRPSAETLRYPRSIHTCDGNESTDEEMDDFI